MDERALDKSPRVSKHPFLKAHATGIGFLLVVLLLVGVLLYMTISWMWDDQRLPLSKMVVQGDLHHVTAKDVQRSLANLGHLGTFMSQDVDTLQKAVLTIPWVAHASIRKQWPDTINVFLTEYHAEAIWNGNELLNNQGKVFNGDIGQLQGSRVKLYGPKGTSVQVLDLWKEINPKFHRLGLNISSLVLNQRGAWQIILGNGVRLELGKDALHERIARFLSLYKQLGTKADKVSYVDLRYDTGAAVGWLPNEESKQESKND
ncbi:cell division protein FtsQ/DivIB [Vibrio sp. S4M6]|uniref:cell division protein FtsQ/DivIB n=1 Tax=Vibrio sinus TaxID=2946865 RepID=UPI00202A3587|nr:cell division protein FtsQ/DivIB [Vibrio sinus]MCL9781469.1 cell division protein FtsQ/DivIB [Vibrio sinus]